MFLKFSIFKDFCEGKKIDCGQVIDPTDAMEGPRRCKRGAKEVQKRCQGGACPLVARSCPLVAASKTISRGQEFAKPPATIGDYDKVCA